MSGLDHAEVVYDSRRWRLLSEKRAKAVKVMEVLARRIPKGLMVVHGSVARGDVSENSDIDVAILEPLPPSIVELALEHGGFKPVMKTLVQATPSNTPKAYIHLDYKDELVVSIPLAPLKPREREFFRWGGELGLDGLLRNIRVPGVDKRLMLIEPTKKGHRESPVPGNEGRVAKVLGISEATVKERVRVLTKRREHGHTGVFIKVELGPDEPLEDVIRRLAKSEPLFRRAMRGWI